MVTLPLTAPALLAVTLFSFTGRVERVPLRLQDLVTDTKLMTLPVGLAQTIFGDIYPWGMLMVSLLIFIPVVIFYMYGQRFMSAGLTAGSVKG